MRLIKVGFKKLKEDAILPVKAHPTDSGFDLFANEDVIIEPGGTTVVKTGVAIKLPPGNEAQVRPRSGITSKTKLRVQLGTIDQDYTGEIGIIVDNIAPHGRSVGYYGSYDCDTVSGAYKVKKGDRLAQLVIVPVPAVESYIIDELPVTDRGANGFGSTGY